MCNALNVVSMPRTIESVRRMAGVKKRLRIAAHARVSQSCGKWRRQYLVAIRMLMAREDATFEFELDKVLGVGLRHYCPEFLVPAAAAIARDHPEAMIEEASSYSAEMIPAPATLSRPKQPIEEPAPVAAVSPPRAAASRPAPASRASAIERPRVAARPVVVAAPVVPAPVVDTRAAIQGEAIPPDPVDDAPPPAIVTPDVMDAAKTSMDALIREAFTAPSPSVAYYECPGCKRELPESVREVHTSNCNAARSGLR